MKLLVKQDEHTDVLEHVEQPVPLRSGVHPTQMPALEMKPLAQLEQEKEPEYVQVAHPSIPPDPLSLQAMHILAPIPGK